MKKMLVEIPVPDDEDPSNVLAMAHEMVTDLWENFLDGNPEAEDTVERLINDETSVSELT